MAKFQWKILIVGQSVEEVEKLVTKILLDIERQQILGKNIKNQYFETYLKEAPWTDICIESAMAEMERAYGFKRNA